MAEIVINEWIETAKELGRKIPRAKGRLLFGIITQPIIDEGDSAFVKNKVEGAIKEKFSSSFF